MISFVLSKCTIRPLCGLFWPSCLALSPLLALCTDTDLFVRSKGTRGSYTLSIRSLSRAASSRPLRHRPGWEFSGIGEIELQPSSAPDRDLNSQPAEIRPIPRVNVSSKGMFEKIVSQGSPVLIEGLDIGACRSKWSLDYLAEQVGDRQVRGSAKAAAD